MTELEQMHEKIETIFSANVDHIHADLLHRFIDEQQAEIDKLRKENKELNDACNSVEWP